MSDTTKTWALRGIRACLTLAFAAAGLAKLMGVQMMVGTFDAVGLGQWFGYGSGIIELGSAVLLWVPEMAAHAAVLLVCTMIGAVIAHATVLGMDSVAGAVVPGLLAAVTLWANRGQLRR